jgi:hypothetical protein
VLAAVLAAVAGPVQSDHCHPVALLWPPSDRQHHMYAMRYICRLCCNHVLQQHHQ